MKNRWISAVVAVALLAPMVSGCGETDKAATGEEAATISVSVFDRGSVPASEGNYEENRWTRWINEQTGLTVNWVPVNRNEAQQKLNMLIATGEAPDLIVEYDQTYIANLVNQGVAQPLDDYIEQYSTSYKEYLEQNEDLKPFVTYNGKMYAFTNRRSEDSIANHGIWIRQDWLDNLGLSMPTTDEELLQVARAFTYDDPDKNGVDDTLGLALMQWQEITQAMYFASSLWYDEGGTLVYGPLTDRFADALALMKTLYDEKLIDQEFITDKQSTVQKQLWVNGKAGILTNSWTEDLNRELMQNDANAKPVQMEALTTKYGKNGLWQETAAQRYVVFNSKMENPEAGVRFLDWMIDEGWFTLMFGEEGVHHRMVDGVPQAIDAEKNKTELSYNVDYAVLNQWELKPEWIPVMASQDALSQELALQRQTSLETALKTPFRRDLPYNPPVAEFVRITSEFSPKRDSIRMNVITGGPEKTPEWGLAELREEWKRLGGEEVEKQVNEWYQANKASFAVE